LVCGDNEIYDVRAECAKTCIKPKGDYDCGVLKPIEGCYCKDGFVYDGTGNCIKVESCGCPLPDNSAILSVGQILTSLDCKSVYSCDGVNKPATVKELTPCTENAVCTIVDNKPSCICKPGFFGDGNNCSNSKLYFL
jgi:hypothetical protein